MRPGQKNNRHLNNDRLRPANTGNASNPSGSDADDTVNKNQLLDENAETYIREAGNIEDLPDENDQNDLDETYREG
jgi:hypothetical protein